MTLINQTALITGATSGIGYHLARLFAIDQCNLIVVSRDEDRLNKVASEFQCLGASSVIVIPADLALQGKPTEVYERVKSMGLTVDILVNDAGVGEHGFFIDTDMEVETKIIQLNIISVMQLTKLFLKDMVARNGGRILQLGSIAGYQPTPLLAVYAATKAFVVSFSDALINELKDTNVKITVLIPGPTDTDFFTKAHAEQTKAARNAAEPADVARIGYDALMQGKHHAVAGMSVQAQIAMSTLLPNEAVTSMARSQMEHKD